MADLVRIELTREEALRELERAEQAWDRLGKLVAFLRRIVALDTPQPESGGVEEAGHRVTMEFDGGGPYMTLHHPEGGCKAPLTCGLCAADLTDPDTKRCYDCEGMESEGCWLQGWFDNLGADELLHGKVTVPFDAEWDQDHPIITIRQPVPQPPQVGLSAEERERLVRVVDYLDSACDAAEDWPGPCDNPQHTQRPEGDEWICERCGSTWWALDGSPAPLHSRLAAFLRSLADQKGEGS